MENYPLFQDLIETDVFGNENEIQPNSSHCIMNLSIRSSLLSSNKTPENIDEEMFHVNYSHLPAKTEPLLDNFPSQKETTKRIRKNSTISLDETIALKDFKAT